VPLVFREAVTSKREAFPQKHKGNSILHRKIRPFYTGVNIAARPPFSRRRAAITLRNKSFL
jgi:hypothetical protein